MGRPLYPRCRNGHALSPANSIHYLYRGRWRRKCRRCHNLVNKIRARAYRRRRALEAGRLPAASHNHVSKHQDGVLVARLLEAGAVVQFTSDRSGRIYLGKQLSGRRVKVMLVRVRRRLRNGTAGSPLRFARRIERE